MNKTSSRELISYGTIVIALCVGAWLLFVQPRQAEAARLSADIDRDLEVQQQMHDGSIGAVISRLETLTDRIAEIERRSQLATDSSRLFETVMLTAERHGVAIQSIDPREARQQGEEGQITVLPMTVVFEGDYTAAVDFVDALTHVDGFIRQTSLRLTPASSGNSVNGRLVCEALSFRLSETLRHSVDEQSKGVSR